jgi:hypothetical protein
MIWTLSKFSIGLVLAIWVYATLVGWIPPGGS